MNNQKVKNIIIIIIVVLAAGFFAFYFVKDTKKSVEVPLGQADISFKNGIINEDVPISNMGNKDSSVPIVKNDKQFNIAMTNATNAFIKNDYGLAIKYYNEALSYNKHDTVYAGLYTVYLTQKNWQKALDSIDQAIKINSVLGDYWKWKILVLNEGMNSNFTDIKDVYNEGLLKIKTEEKINIVTYVANIASIRGEKIEAINLWQKAIEMNPKDRDLFQKEIDLLK